MNRRQTTAQATTTAHLEAQKRAKFEQRKKETKQQAMPCPITCYIYHSGNVTFFQAVAEKGEVVPTLSELPDQSLNSPSKFPSTAFYDTISTYPVGHGMNTSAYKAILLGAKPENQITCKCKHDCVTIPNCPCRRMAVWMNHGDCESLLVSGHEIDFSQGVHENKFYFSCSSGCKCTGCSLNSVLEAKKDHNEKVKVTRRRLDVGFGVEAKRHIEKGEFIATFVGTLCGPLTANGLKAETINVRYSYTATNKNSIKQVTKLLKSKEYVRYLREAYHSDIIIDPLERGNFTRFFNHSCQPNLTIVKVCAGGVSPLDLNMVFVANRAINQGEEMTFDYGPHYLMGQCLCEICKNKEDVDMATAENINGGSESENICPNTPNRLGKRPSGVKKPQIPKKSKKNGLMTLPTIVTGETLPLFSRLKDFGKNLLCNFPGTAFFTSIVVNVLGAYLSKAVTEAIKLGNQNPICCSCGPGVSCMENPDCECAIASKQFQKKLKIPPVLRKKAVKLDENQYWRIQFCCGPKCQCSSECSLKGLDEIDKDHNKKFEVYREEEKMGFCVSTKKYIAKGTPVMSFNGEIVGKRALKKGSDAEQYSLKLIDQDQALIEFLKTANFLAKNLLRPLATAFDRVVFINPLKYGNVGRFLSHSCRPNLEMMRIFQGGVSPGHMRIVFIANCNIKAGENLSFDYGEDYVVNHIENCMCPEVCMKKNMKESKMNTVGAQRAVRNQTQETSMMGKLRSFFR